MKLFILAALSIIALSIFASAVGYDNPYLPKLKAKDTTITFNNNTGVNFSEVAEKWKTDEGLMDNVPDLYSTLNNVYWRKDGTNAPPTADWQMGDYGFLFGGTLTEKIWSSLTGQLDILALQKIKITTETFDLNASTIVHHPINSTLTENIFAWDSDSSQPLFVSIYGTAIGGKQNLSIHRAGGDVMFTDKTQTISGTLTYTGINIHQNNEQFNGNNTYSGQRITSPAFVNLSSFTIPYKSEYMILDTENGIGLDNLTTINGGISGAHLIIQTTNNARDIIVYETGNINLGSSTRTLNARRDKLSLIYDPLQTEWVETSWANN